MLCSAYPIRGIGVIRGFTVSIFSKILATRSNTLAEIVCAFLPQQNLKETGIMSSDWLQVLTQPDVVVFAIPIIAILVGGILGITYLVMSHRERMTMIQHGIHPDYPPEEEEDPETAGSAQSPESYASG